MTVVGKNLGRRVHNPCQGWVFSHKLEIKMPKKVSWIDRLRTES